MMDIAKLLQGALANGWDGIDAAPARVAEMNRQAGAEMAAVAAREAAIARAALDNEAGRKLVELLLRKIVLRGEQADELAATTAEAYAIAKARRAGENGVVFMIINMLTADLPASASEGG